MENYIIYKITNNINGKAYVGRTKDLERRLKQHITHSVCKALHRAIKKYGIENFTISILHESDNFEEMIEAERAFIVSENTMTPNGYNLILETDQGREPSEETRVRMSTSQQKQIRYNKNGYFGVKESRNGFVGRTYYDKQEFSKLFKTKIEAAEAYDKVNLYLRGVGCKLNFPEKLQQYLQEDLKSYFEWFCYKESQTSKYKGVSWHKLLKKWRAYYYQNGKQIIVGNFEDEEEAYKAVKKYFK